MSFYFIHASPPTSFHAHILRSSVSKASLFPGPSNEKMYKLSVGVFVHVAPSYTSIISSNCILMLFLPAFAMPFKIPSCGEQLMRYFLSSRVESRTSMTALALPSAATGARWHSTRAQPIEPRVSLHFHPCSPCDTFATA